MKNSQWHPIETAPKDRRILLGFSEELFIGISSVFGKWESDQYATYPKPYWRHDLTRLCGIKVCRNHPPTHWMELPEKPDQ